MSSTVGVSKSRTVGVSEVPEESAFAAESAAALPLERRGKAAQFRRIVVVCEIVADLLTIISAVTLGYAAYDFSHLGRHIFYPYSAVLSVAFGFAIVMVLMLDRVGAYRRGTSLLRVRETEQVLRVSAEAFLTVFAISFFSSFLFSRWLLAFCLALVPTLLFAEKNLIYLAVRFLHSRGYGNEKVLIYGSGSTGRRVLSALRSSPKLGLEPIALVDDDASKAGSVIFEMGYERRRSAPILQGPITRHMIEQLGVDSVMIAIPSIGRAKFTQMVDEAFYANAKVSFVPNHLLPSDPWVDYQDIDGVLLASFGRERRRLGYEVVKRVCDFLGSILLLTIGAPLFLLLALLIRVDSPGPILFRQERVGRDGKKFRMYKFRTMQINAAPYDYSPNTPCDPRITRIGRFLRRSSLDELPQLINVVIGEMSLVGPRPEMPFIVDQYNERHRQRLAVQPGVTGLWQLSGDRAFLIHENIEYDLYYIQHRNLFMDLAILIHTSVFAMRGI